MRRWSSSGRAKAWSEMMASRWRLISSKHAFCSFLKPTPKACGGAQKGFDSLFFSDAGSMERSSRTSRKSRLTRRISRSSSRAMLLPVFWKKKTQRSVGSAVGPAQSEREAHSPLTVRPSAEVLSTI